MNLSLKVCAAYMNVALFVLITDGAWGEEVAPSKTHEAHVNHPHKGGKTHGGAGSGIGSASAGSNASAMRGHKQIEKALNQNENLEHLGLQENLHGETRTYSALSNVTKEKHRAVKKTVDNLK